MTNPPLWKRNLAICAAGSFSTIIAMTLLLPFLPLYVRQLGVTEPAAIVQWSGIAYGATFFTAAWVAPLWGWLGDRYGRKVNLIRASLGMAVAMSLIGLAQNAVQLVALRLLVGLLGGYASGSMVLVAAQTPKERSGFALGMLSAAIMAGNLAGPLIGGFIPPLIGVRATFLATGAVLFVTFVMTAVLIEEAPPSAHDSTRKTRAAWSAIPDRRPVLAMLLTGFLLMVANMSIEPIITVYVGQFVPSAQVTRVSGIVMSVAALGSILSSTYLGKLADRVGHWKIVVACLGLAAVLLLPQAFVTQAWQLILLRFLMGLSLGGLLPSIASIIRHNVPVAMVGGALGYSISAQYSGQVIGPVAGGFVGGQVGMSAVFLGTSALMALGAALNFFLERGAARNRRNDSVA